MKMQRGESDRVASNDEQMATAFCVELNVIGMLFQGVWRLASLSSDRECMRVFVVCDPSLMLDGS